MLVEKEVIRPGRYWYQDEATGLPRLLVVTPELTRYWGEQGNAMLSSGLTVPVPYEHDFSAHPMTPREKLLNNAGEVKEYQIKTIIDPKTKKEVKDVLFSAVDVQDPDVRGKIGHSIRWTSPWINSFTDGKGKEWKNVISHLALTTRPRVVEQEPFGSVAAALSMATEVPISAVAPAPKGGFCLSRAGRLVIGKTTKRLYPRYPMAFSLYGGGIRLGSDDAPPKDQIPADDDDAVPDPDDGDADTAGLMDPLKDAGGDVQMEELLCDLLQALGVPMPDESNENEFKRHLYEAAMSKIKELTSKGMDGADDKSKMPDQNRPPGSNPHTSQPNPLIQQEQQPMYMSLDDINKLPDPMKGVALAMYQENVKLRTELDANAKVTTSLRDAKLKEAAGQRAARVSILGKLSPRVKADLDAMLALPGMALSMGDGGAVVDPMASTLAVLEKGLADLPRLLTTEHSALSVAAQPTDDGMLSQERIDELADDMARKMGAPPKAKKAS